MDGDSKFQCCFCGAAMGDEDRPVMLILRVDNSGGEQQLFSHPSCLRRAVDPSIPLLSELLD
jgi:hypothetical protein